MANRDPSDTSVTRKRCGLSRLSDVQRRAALEQLEARDTALTDAEVLLLDEVFVDIYRAQSREVQAYFQSRRLRPAEAEDLFHETILDLYDGLVDNGFPVNLSAWVHVIAKRKLWKLMLDRACSPVSESVPSSGSEVPRSSGPMSAIERALERRMVAESLVPQLTQEQQWLFERIVVSERTLPEIAAELGIPVGTVKSRARALRAAIVALARQFVPLSEREEA